MSGAGGREEGRSRRRLQETPRQEERQEERGPARPGQDRAGRGGGRAVLTPEAGRSTLGAGETMSQTHGLFLVNEEAWASGSRRGANGPQAGVSGQAGRVARNPGRGGSPAGRGLRAAPRLMLRPPQSPLPPRHWVGLSSPRTRPKAGAGPAPGPTPRRQRHGTGDNSSRHLLMTPRCLWCLGALPPSTSKCLHRTRASVTPPFRMLVRISPGNRFLSGSQFSSRGQGPWRGRRHR